MVSMGEDGFHQAPIAAAKPANPVNPTHNRNQTIILPPFPPTTTKQKNRTNENNIWELLFFGAVNYKKKKNPQGWFYYGQTHRVFNLSSLPAPSFPPTALFVFFVPRVQGSSAYDRATGVSITSRQ